MVKDDKIHLEYEYILVSNEVLLYLKKKARPILGGVFEPQTGNLYVPTGSTGP